MGYTQIHPNPSWELKRSLSGSGGMSHSSLIEPILSPGATVELNRFTTQLTPLLEQLMNQTREFPALLPPLL